MLAHGSQHPIPGQRCAPKRALLGLALTLASCGGDPLAPADAGSPADPGTTPVPAGETDALVTSQRIAFVSRRNGQLDIYKMDPAGGNLVRVTSKPEDETDPAWSFDNKRVALVRPRLGANNHMINDIWVVNADGSNGHWARSTPTTCPLFRPSWSPTGSALALTMQCGGTYYIAHLNLNTGELSGYSTGYGGRPGLWATYTKAGQIVYLGPTSKTIERINADGSGHKTLLVATAPMGAPVLSPDGTKVAFTRYQDPSFLNSDIFVTTIATGKTMQLTSSPAGDVQPTWSPDGSKIAFMSGRSGQAQIWTMNATGGAVTRITQTSTSETSPAWTH